MEIKTLEELFIKQYTDLENELYLAKKEIEELNKPKTTEEAIKKEIKKDMIQMCIAPTYYYQIKVLNYFDINEVLKDNKKTPEDLLNIQDDDELIDFCRISGGRWFRSIGMAEERKSDYYIYDFYGNDYVLEFNKDPRWTTLHYVDNKDIFLDPAKATDELLKRLKTVIEEYKHHNHHKKFYEEGN